MKSLCTCAALAVATAIAHGSFADALAPGDRAARSEVKATKLVKLDSGSHCTEAINEFRTSLGSTTNYQPNSNEESATDLSDFFTATNCEAIKSGEFQHIWGSSTKVFVVSATRPTPSSSGTKISCDEALSEWKTGFANFEGQDPPAYSDATLVYANPNSVGLVSLLSASQQTIYCGTTDTCGDDTLVCYYKPSGIEEETVPVSEDLWHKLQESHKVKPALAADDAGSASCVTAVNAARGAGGLELAGFTKGSNLEAGAKKLYGLTCEAIDTMTVDPTAAAGHTIIYATKEGDTPPTAEEAVEQWKKGAARLGTGVLPAFTKKSKAADGEIYYDSAVAGFVSIMTDNTRETACYKATGCTNAALICLLKGPTLEENQKPITDETWKKVLDVYGEKMDFKEREEGESCLTEINDFRAQDGLALPPFAAATDLHGAKPKASELIGKGLTCEALKSGNAPILFTDQEISLMYYMGETATCSLAVREWKNGIDLFSDFTIPPKYTSTEEVYKKGAATNFISLVSEGTDTKIKCYTVTGCSEPGLLCLLQPPVFKENEAPISEETWKKVTDTVTSGAASASAYGALLSSVFVAVGLFALSF